MNSSNFKPGDIVVAPVLFSEQFGMKKRPTLVISNSKYNEQSEDIVVLKITSKGNGSKFDISLNSKDLLSGELKVESQIMTDNPVTLYKPLIEQKIGQLTPEKILLVKRKIVELYEL